MNPEISLRRRIDAIDTAATNRVKFEIITGVKQVLLQVVLVMKTEVTRELSAGTTPASTPSWTAGSRPAAHNKQPSADHWHRAGAAVHELHQSRTVRPGMELKTR